MEGKLARLTMDRMMEACGALSDPPQTPDEVEDATALVLFQASREQMQQWMDCAAAATGNAYSKASPAALASLFFVAGYAAGLKDA
jgi:hypothetical protein